MKIIFPPQKQTLIRLLESDVQFLIIGGYAVNIHGYGRTTGDIDIWLKPSNENRERFISFMKAEGFEQESLERISKTDFTKHAAFHIGE